MNARELAEKASPGPWRACGANDGRCRCGLVWSIPHDYIAAKAIHADDDKDVTCGEGLVDWERHGANAELIARAVNSFLPLVKVAERAPCSCLYERGQLVGDLCWVHKALALANGECDK